MGKKHQGGWGLMERRTGLIVAYDILMEARGGSNKTNLVYRCNLNFKLIKTWLSRLIAKGLLEPSPSSRTWATTTQGAKFILAMEAVKSLWDGEPPPEGIEMEVII